MKLELQIDREARLSVYRQIAEQIRSQVHTGQLPAGTRLPPIRQLADQLGVTRLTIQNGYNLLHEEGLLEAIVGKGTFISQEVELRPVDPSFGQFTTPDKVIADMMQSLHFNGMRSMAVAVPDNALLPTEVLAQILGSVQAGLNNLLGYGHIEGDPRLRMAIADWLAEVGISANSTEVIITSGAMQALNLVARAFTRRGNKVLLEEPTYIGFFNVIRAEGLQPVTIPVGTDGPDLNRLEQLLKQHQPRFYYSIPNFHNPTGISFSRAKRQAILALTRRYNTLLVEDDVYGRLSYDGPPPTPYKALPDSEHVIYLGSLSKVAMPGLRIGYIHARPDLLAEMVALRHAIDLCGSPLLENLACQFLLTGAAKRHIKRVVPIYRARRNALLASLQRHMPADVSWTRPAGGYCGWLTMPRYFAPGALCQQASQAGVGIGTGDAFFYHQPEVEHIRLCFGNQTEEGIDAGVRQLAAIIKEKTSGQAGTRFS
ncbi:MAG: PLP-dependent aminotransferase family protein [Anaerolineales bacterium]|nr:PLP-dependent aminotransferase family protein [Anaerolineales bacterium]MCB0010946.1 PLP-dependent aminotransferase family protein [Anaerolineales bacterium]MCB0016622.1 PLP-dependent aminotransferase family protein [Anaerolineales bacterium]MCB8959302.1 PLP-dependent aminotransferase family protein [Ardenticatenales bacterium]